MRSTANPLASHALLYLRVSTSRQAHKGGESEGYSIPAQRSARMAKAAALGAVVEGEFVDAGASARSADRDGLQALLTPLVGQDAAAGLACHRLQAGPAGA